MGEGRENEVFKEEAEEAMRHMSHLTITHVAFKKHSAQGLREVAAMRQLRE